MEQEKPLPFEQKPDPFQKSEEKKPVQYTNGNSSELEAKRKAYMKKLIEGKPPEKIN